MALTRTGYANLAAFPVTGAANIIYVDLSNGNEYLWVNSAYAAYTGTLAGVRTAYQDAAWFNANPNFLLGKGQRVDLLQTGTYKLGDGVTVLSGLSFLGGSTAYTASNGITLVGNDFQFASQNISQFVNDSAYITAAALAPYLTSAAAALTYQPIGSYLTGLIVGTTAIASGTNTNILYNNSGVLGEYSVTGTGTTAVLSTSPTFTNTAASVNGITISNTTNNANVYSGVIFVGAGTTLGQSVIGVTATANSYVGSEKSMWYSQKGIRFFADGTIPIDFCNNGVNTPRFEILGNGKANFNAQGQANTLGTNSPIFKVTGTTNQWATGALPNQYFNYFSANTVSFVGASTATNVYGLYVEAATAGANATITNNYAAGFGGKVESSQSSNAITGFYMRNTSAGSGAYAVMNFTNNSVTTDGAAWVGLSGGGVGGLIGASTLLMYRQGKIQLFTDANSPIEFVTAGVLQWAIAGTTGTLTAEDAKNISFGTTTGTKIGTATTQKIGFWNATPIVQPTTAVAAGTLAAGGGTTLTDTHTIDGYTLLQVVKALRNTGLLA